MSEFRVEVRNQSADALKITWLRDGESFLSYRINSGMVRRISARIRALLTLLVSECMDRGADSSGPTLKRLAMAGKDLHDTLFLDAGESEQSPQDILEYIRRFPDLPVTISVDQTVYVPWGLIYDGDTEKLSGDSALDAEAFRDFWCIRRKLSTVYRRITPDRFLRKIPASNFRILPVINRNAFEAARSQLTVTEEQSLLEWLMSRFMPVYSASDFKASWAENASKIGMLFFHCHADGTKLALSEEDLIESHQLKLEFSRSVIGKRDWSCLLFLNGCSTATGDSDGAFLEAAGETGMSGFIGTEAEVPDVFALRFSLDFLSKFMQGNQSLRSTMLGLRVRHFPLSLLYSVYTYPGLQLESDNVLTPIQLPPANYSYGQLGTSTI
jgi:hypothetical protein